MRFIIVAVISLLFMTVIHAIDYPEGADTPHFDADEIFDNAEDFGSNWFGDDWVVVNEADNGFSQDVTWSNGFSIIAVSQYRFMSPATRYDYFFDLDEHFSIVLSRYAPYTQTAQCRIDDVSLYEFDAEVNGIPFVVRLYFWRTESRRVWNIGYYFPTTALDILNDYTEDFQPNLISCHGDN